MNLIHVLHGKIFSKVFFCIFQKTIYNIMIPYRHVLRLCQHLRLLVRRADFPKDENPGIALPCHSHIAGSHHSGTHSNGINDDIQFRLGPHTDQSISHRLQGTVRIRFDHHRNPNRAFSALLSVESVFTLRFLHHEVLFRRRAGDLELHLSVFIDFGSFGIEFGFALSDDLLGFFLGGGADYWVSGFGEGFETDDSYWLGWFGLFDGFVRHIVQELDPPAIRPTNNKIPTLHLPPSNHAIRHHTQTLLHPRIDDNTFSLRVLIGPHIHNLALQRQSLDEIIQTLPCQPRYREQLTRSELSFFPTTGQDILRKYIVFDQLILDSHDGFVDVDSRFVYFGHGNDQ
mmetsp:Transcript_15486/g.29319  ORF Transcript_15486/g.29319 Transcript_15486/m.29319 type:complete len:343 (+) Transcript_15486:515-1543(+)